jgi:hypothetical protein
VDNACRMMLFVLGALGLPRAVCWDAAKSSVAAAAAGLGTCSPPLHGMLCMTDMCVCVWGGGGGGFGFWGGGGVPGTPHLEAVIPVWLSYGCRCRYHTWLIVVAAIRVLKQHSVVVWGGGVCLWGRDFELGRQESMLLAKWTVELGRKGGMRQ